jgi:hypothetical protein
MNDKDITAFKLLHDSQAACPHSTAHRDHYHEDYTIWCPDCKMRWQRGDTKTALVCQSGPQKNHTGKSFEDMEVLVTPHAN